MTIRPRFDLTGRVFNRITVSGPAEKSGWWKCRCSCGHEWEVIRGHLLSNRTKSCGCLKGSYGTARLKSHGLSKDPAYSPWCRMKQRCMNSKCDDFEYYGGRGIKVCERWQKSFEDFLADIGPRPTKLHTIERSNNNGNYEPGNCYWATREQQTANRRTHEEVKAQKERKSAA